jgi:hypothetical protein
MSFFFQVEIFFLRHSEWVSVDLFNFAACGLAEKDEDVIALGEFSGLDRQRSERPIFAEPDFIDPASEDFPPSDGLKLTLLRAGGKGESQDSFHFYRDAIERRRFVDPLARRLSGRVAQRRMSADGCRLDDLPGF